MLTTTRRVWKADEITLESPLCLGFDPPGQVPDREAPGGSTGPRVRIAQNQSDHAVLEVTCPCGRTTFIRCEYAPRST